MELTGYGPIKHLRPILALEYSSCSSTLWLLRYMAHFAVNAKVKLFITKMSFKFNNLICYPYNTFVYKYTKAHPQSKFCFNNNPLERWDHSLSRALQFLHVRGEGGKCIGVRFAFGTGEVRNRFIVF